MKTARPSEQSELSDDAHDFPVDFKYPANDKKKTPRAHRGPIHDDKHKPADWVKPQSSQDKQNGGLKSRAPPFTQNNVPPQVPNTLESAFTGEGSSLRNIHESLELLVEGHIKEAQGIMGRTILVSTEDAHTISDVMFRAKHGIGGRLKKPQPWLSEWMLDKLHSLPSVGGKSRTEFVQSWQNSSEERHQRQKQMDDERKRALMGA